MVTSLSERQKWLALYSSLALISLIFIILKIGFGLWFLVFSIIWVMAVLAHSFSWVRNVQTLKIFAGGLFVFTVAFSFLGASLGIQPLNPAGNSTVDNKTYKCADKEIHSKKVASGETVYWQCQTATNTSNKPYDRLIIQVAENISGFPFNQKISSASTANDIRMYCMTYKIRGQSEQKNYCSSFSDYTQSKYGCYSPEECYQKNSTSASPWIMPFVPDTIVGSIYPSLSKDVSGIESIEQLIIYPVGPFNSQGGTDINEAPVKYQPVKTINL